MIQIACLVGLYSEASIVWLMSAHVEFEKHIPSAMDVWGKTLCVLYFTEGYYKAALHRQT